MGTTKRGKGTQWMVVVDGQGVPLGNLLAAAFPAEVKLIEPTLETIAVPRSGGAKMLFGLPILSRWRCNTRRSSRA